MSSVGTPDSANSRVIGAIATRFRRSTPRKEKPCNSGAIRVDKDAGSSPTTLLTLILLATPVRASLARTAKVLVIVRINHLTGQVSVPPFPRGERSLRRYLLP